MALYNDKRMQIYSFSVIYRNFKILPNLGEAVDHVEGVVGAVIAGDVVDQVLLTWVHVEAVVRAAIAGDAVDKVLLTWVHVEGVTWFHVEAVVMKTKKNI